MSVCTPEPSNDHGVSKAEWAEARALARLADRNAAFAVLSPARKRVAVATEVLVMMRIKALIATPGLYIGPIMERGGTHAVVEEATSVNGWQCHTCALGAVFAAAVERSAIPYGFERDMGRLRAPDYWARLASVFSCRQLTSIEAAFEGNGGCPSVSRYRASPGAIEFNKGIRSSARRMRRIMRNIIANNGTFVP